jgi:hypothetical protein
MEIIEKESTGKHEITAFKLNKYKFLITLIHEISHLVAFEKFGRKIKPSVMNGSIPTVDDSLYIRPEIFPSHLLPLLVHFKTQRPAVIQIRLCRWH